MSDIYDRLAARTEAAADDLRRQLRSVQCTAGDVSQRLYVSLKPSIVFTDPWDGERYEITNLMIEHTRYADATQVETELKGMGYKLTAKGVRHKQAAGYWRNLPEQALDALAELLTEKGMS